MKLLEKSVKINLISLIAILVIMVCVIVIVITIYSYGEKECVSSPLSYANNHSYNYWWDHVEGIRIGSIG